MQPGTTLRLSVRHMVTGDVLQCELDRLPVTLGREETNVLRLDDAAVSRVHATLEWRDGTILLTDLASLNGTYQRGFKIPSFAPRDVGWDFLFAIGPFVVRGVVERVEVASTTDATRAVAAEEIRRLLCDDEAITLVRRML